MPTDPPARSRGDAVLAAAFARVLERYPSQVAETITSLHRPVRDQDGLADLLHRATATAVEWIPDVDWAGVTVQIGGPAFTAACTDPRVLAIDGAMYALDDGPCLRAIRTWSSVAYTPDQFRAYWPTLAAPARAEGVLSFLSTPLLDEGVPRGSFNLYSGGDKGFDPFEADFLLVLCEYVSRGLGEFAALRGAAEQNRQLREAMISRGPIDQAKGILMAVHQISSDKAFEMLRAASRSSNVKLREVATQFVATHANQPVSDTDAPDTLTDFHTAFDHSPVGIALTDLTGHVLLANPALIDLVPDVDAGTALAKPSVLDHMHEDDADAASAALRELVDGLDEGAHNLVRVPVRMLDADGQTVHALLAASVVQTSAGEADQLVVTVDDVDALVRGASLDPDEATLPAPMALDEQAILD
jgi:PAS domain S-box-containing protein